MKRFISIIVILIMTLDISANSALMYYTGNKSGEVIYYGDEDIPIILDKEVLTFELPDVPDYFRSTEDIENYDNRILVDYTFTNPSDEDIKMRLLFPIGNVPYNYIAEDFTYDDLKDHGVYVNDQKIEAKVRYSFDIDPYTFSYDDLANISDQPIKDDNYDIDQDSIVRKYTYRLKSQGEDDLSAAFFTIPKSDDRLIYIDEINSTKDKGDKIEVGTFIDDQTKTVDVYVIGEPIEELTWDFYDDLSQDKMIEGTSELLATKEIGTLWEVIQGIKHDIDDIDHYNRWFTMMISGSQGLGVMMDVLTLNDPRSMMRWYDYTLDIKAHKTVSNKISVPVYPDKDMSYDGDVYTYHYLLSPAEVWQNVRSLTIDIKTDKYMVFDEDGYTKTDDGYTISYDHLKEGELRFSLCAISDPQKEARGLHVLDLYFLAFMIVFITLVVGIIYSIWRFMNRKR